MYLYLDEVTLIASQSKVRSDDPVVYEREYRGERILTIDDKPSKYTDDARRYGVLYFDARDQPCVVPDAWSEDDAILAREAIY